MKQVIGSGRGAQLRRLIVTFLLPLLTISSVAGSAFVICREADGDLHLALLLRGCPDSCREDVAAGPCCDDAPDPCSIPAPGGDPTSGTSAVSPSAPTDLSCCGSECEDFVFSNSFLRGATRVVPSLLTLSCPQLPDWRRQPEVRSPREAFTVPPSAAHRVREVTVLLI